MKIRDSQYRHMMSAWFSKTLFLVKTESWNGAKIFWNYSEFLEYPQGRSGIFLIRNKLNIHPLLEQQLSVAKSSLLAAMFP